MPDPIREPRADAEAVIDPSPSGIATTATRALVFGAALTAPVALEGLGPDIAEIGILAPPRPWGDWAERTRAYNASDVILSRYGILDAVHEAEQERYVAPNGGEFSADRTQQRLDLWGEVVATQRQAETIAWLRTLMTDSKPVAAAAASVALSHWRRVKEVPVPFGLEAARVVRNQFAASESPEAQLIVRAAIGADGGTEALLVRSAPLADDVAIVEALAEQPLATLEPPDRSSEPTVAFAPAPPAPMSTMVHGTAAWAGSLVAPGW